MKINKKLINLLIIGYLLSAIPVVANAAQDFTLEINKNSFRPNETIEISAKIQNQQERPSNITFNLFLINTENDAFGQVIPYSEHTQLLPFETKKIWLYNLPASEYLPSGKYKIYAELLEKDGPKIHKEADFIISDTLKQMKVSLASCQDSLCNNPKKIFIRGEKIYLNYTSDVLNPIITATLFYPDRTQHAIVLPIDLTTDQIGTYTLSVRAEKKGYLVQDLSTQFGVIKKGAEVKKIKEEQISESVIVNELLMKNGILPETIINQTQIGYILHIKAAEKRKLLYLFPITIIKDIKIDVHIKIDVRDGKIISIEKPWWSILAK